MAKEKELSSTDKRRRTTLRKKSVEELVGIILRKDDTERRLNKSVETFKKLQEINDKRINTLQDSLDKSEEIQMSQEKTITSLNATLDAKCKCITILEDDNKALYDRIKVLENTINSRNKELHVFFITVVVLLIMLVFSVIL
mgnify:CR=1 FL=1|jgi:uncharacterized coiled-coil protein SlyX